MAELILALDLPDRSAALRMLDRLPSLRWAKIGSILRTAEGPTLVREISARGVSVFLDLKWHDIPNTVRGAVSVARGLGVRMVTVHLLGGPAMLRAAADAAGDELSVVGVTVLTSHDESEYATRPAGRRFGCWTRRHGWRVLEWPPDWREWCRAPSRSTGSEPGSDPTP